MRTVRACTNPIRVFLPRSAARLGGEAWDRAGAGLRFAAGVANIAPGASGTVKLKLTSQDKHLVGTTTKRWVRGVIEIVDHD